MAETYFLGSEVLYGPTLERLPVDPSPDDLTTAPNGSAWTAGSPANQPYVEHQALWALMNKAGSGRRITIQNLVMNPQQGRTTTTVGNYGMRRLSAMEGGEDISENLTPMDSANNPLPAEVLLRDGPSITTTGGELRRLVDIQLLNPTRQTMFPCWRSMGNEDIITSQRGLTDCQPQVLREGQGLGVMTTGSVGRENYAVAIQVFLVVSGQTYMLRHAVQTGIWPALMGIFNGSGSGVVIEVRSVSVTEISTDGVGLRRFVLAPISGIHPNGAANSVGIQKMDSTNQDLPSQVVSAIRAGVVQIGNDSALVGNRPDNYPLRRMSSAVLGIGPGLACVLHAQKMLGELVDFSSLAGNSIVLNEGEGIAIFQMGSFDSLGSGYWLTCLFTAETVGGQQISPVIGSTIIRGAIT